MDRNEFLQAGFTYIWNAPSHALAAESERLNFRRDKRDIC